MVISSPETRPGLPLPATSMIPCVTVLGIRFQRLRLSESVQLIKTYIRERRPRQVCLCNAYTLALSQRDEPYRSILNRSDLVLADGMSIVWGARWIGLQVPQRVAGPDLTVELCQEASKEGHTIFFLGSSEENLRNLKSVLLNRWPALKIVGCHSPSMCDSIGEEENRAILAEIHAARPDILFVGMSAPKQEKWIAANLTKLQVPVCIGIGAAFDFLSGRIPRAPDYLQKMGLEWLHRLGCEPRRLWKRYLLGNAIFLSLLLKELIKRRLSLKRN